jgi:hypothetical protein
MPQNPPRKLIHLVLVLFVGLIALGVRLYFAERHVIDEDEPTYLKAAINYANILRAGDYSQLAWHEENYQHPPLAKILDGLVLLTQPPLAKMHNKYFDTGLPIQTAEGRPWGMAARYTSVILGTVTSMVIAIFDPLAGLFFATQSLVAISTSVVGLEALPLLTSFLCGIFYLRWCRQNLRADDSPKYAPVWLALSALTLGMTAASKYTYCIVGVAIILHFIITSIRQPKLRKLAPQFMVWAGFSLLAFFAFDPYLWPHPIQRLQKSLLFHVKYSESSNVSGAGFPFWQPLIWLSSPYYSFYPIYKNHILFAPDRLIFILALLGMPILWNKDDFGSISPDLFAGENSGKRGFFRVNPNRLDGSNFYLIWLVAGLVVLLIWPTKWPQYVLIIMAPLCLSASQGAWMVFNWVKQRALSTFQHTPG